MFVTSPKSWIQNITLLDRADNTENRLSRKQLHCWTAQNLNITITLLNRTDWTITLLNRTDCTLHCELRRFSVKFTILIVELRDYIIRLFNCTDYGEPWAESTSPFRQRRDVLSMTRDRKFRQRRGVASECCHKACTVSELMTYCGKLED